MAEGDHAIRFRALLLPELAYLRRVGMAITGNRSACDDLVQESVLRVLRYFQGYKGDGFRAWMAAIMRNVYRDRPKMNPVSMDDEWLHTIPDSTPDPEENSVNRSNAARLRKLVAQLPDNLREVLVLREFGDLSYTQIAAVLELPVGTVMSRLSRARDSLRSAWFDNKDRYAS